MIKFFDPGPGTKILQLCQICISFDNKLYLCKNKCYNMIGRFFYLPGTKKFNITPRFYDPDKEEREDRERRIKEEMGIADEKKDDISNYRPNIKGSFRMAQGGATKTSEDARRASNRRLIILILILALIMYLFFYSDFTF